MGTDDRWTMVGQIDEFQREDHQRGELYYQLWGLVVVFKRFRVDWNFLDSLDKVR